jgi:hypothetical protein
MFASIAFAAAMSAPPAVALLFLSLASPRPQSELANFGSKRNPEL